MFSLLSCAVFPINAASSEVKQRSQGHSLQHDANVNRVIGHPFRAADE
jgi:hypothetical protein